MTKKVAKKLITELQQSLNDDTVRQQFWMDKGHAYIHAIFGTPQESIALPMYYTYYNGDRNYENWDKQKINFRKQKLKELFDAYIVMIDNEVFKQKNIFSRYNNATVWGILISIIISIFSLGLWNGNYWGQKVYECRNVQLSHDNKVLQDSLSLLKYQIQQSKKEATKENAATNSNKSITPKYTVKKDKK